MRQGAQRPARPYLPTPPLFTTVLLVTLLAGASLLISGCSDDSAVAPTDAASDSAGPTQDAIITHAELTPGEPIEADLDGDGATEQVLLDPSDHTIFIEDGSVSYRSRDQWEVVQAALGDLDGDGLTEVVALLDSSAGRHIGLFAYFGGEYRERLVSQAIDPPPVSFEIVAPQTPREDEAAGVDTEAGDTLELLQPSSAAGDAPQTMRLRWNGFGFTRIE